MIAQRTGHNFACAGTTAVNKHCSWHTLKDCLAFGPECFTWPRATFFYNYFARIEPQAGYGLRSLQVATAVTSYVQDNATYPFLLKLARGIDSAACGVLGKA